MRHQNFIDKFIARRDEFDDVCHIIWLPACPGATFNNVLPEPRTDILGAFLCEEDKGLEFLTSSPDDRDQLFVSLGDLPVHIRKKVVEYIES